MPLRWCGNRSRKPGRRAILGEGSTPSPSAIVHFLVLCQRERRPVPNSKRPSSPIMAEAPVSEAGGSRFESEEGHHFADVAQSWQRHQVESLVVVGSSPTVGTIPGSVAQSAEASDSKPVTVWVRLPPEPPSWRGDRAWQGARLLPGGRRLTSRRAGSNPALSAIDARRVFLDPQVAQPERGDS